MNLKTNPMRALLFTALCLPCLTAAAADPGTDVLWVAQAGPTAVETEYWHSAEKLGTPAAYQAYLANFPNGFFARSAAAALAKAEAPQPPLPVSAVSQPAAPLTAAPQASGFPDPAMLRKLAVEADNSSAVSFKVGDVFTGPGPLPVGHLGSRKQFVVPAGRWVVLAAEDGYSVHRTPFQMTAITWGLFEGQVVRSIVTLAFDRRPGGMLTNTWNDAQRCESGAANAKFHWRGTAGLLKQCVLVTTFPRQAHSKSWKGNIWDAVQGSLSKLGARTDGAKGLVTDLYLTDNRSGYMRVSRYDFGAAGAGGAGQDAGSLDLRLEARIKWAQEYAALAAVGFTRDLDVNDLQAGGEAPAGPLHLVR